MKSKRENTGGTEGIDCPNVDTVEGVRVMLGWCLRKMFAGELTESRAKSGAYIAGVLLRASEIALLEQRITQLEERNGVR